MRLLVKHHFSLKHYSYGSIVVPRMVRYVVCKVIYSDRIECM